MTSAVMGAPTNKVPEVDRAAGRTAALRARRDRADLKARLRSGEVGHREVLLEAKQKRESIAASLRVSEFLRTLPFVGEAKQERIMNEMGISASRRLGGLGERQAERMWDFLGQWIQDHPVRQSAAA